MNIPIVAGIMLMLFGVYLLLGAINNYKKASASLTWPSVKGKLRKVELWGTRNVDGDMKASERLDVTYEYDVSGHEYAGNTVAFYTLMYPETTDFANKFAVDSEVDVYYNPDKPDEAVLVTGLREDRKRYSDVILSGAAVGVGFIIAVSGWAGFIG
ncbi:MAG: DUF3592 domain-containing protein [Ketobacteraceae bacterium]|nr:DUF3592 domain-containing protein [Ketobacteraceae bacterium]